MRSCCIPFRPGFDPPSERRKQNGPESALLRSRVRDPASLGRSSKRVQPRPRKARQPECQKSVAERKEQAKAPDPLIRSADRSLEAPPRDRRKGADSAGQALRSFGWSNQASLVEFADFAHP